MARARNIKPGFFANEDLAELAFETRLLFIGLWTLADRDGRQEDRPKKIKMAIFPGDNLDVDSMLDDLAGYGFIQRYEVNGAKLIKITNWHKHQNPHHTEKPSTLPDVNGEITVKTPLEPSDTPKQDGGNPADSLIPDSGFTDSPIPDSGLLPPEDCAEPQSDSPPKAKPVRASFDYSTGELSGLSDEILRAWAQAYPAIDVRQEIAKAKAWMLANPKNRKSNIEKFLTNWLTRAQDKAPPHGQPNENVFAPGRSSPQNRQLSAADRIRANNAREREEERLAAARADSAGMGADGGDVWPQVDQPVWRPDGPGECVGGVLEGAFERAD